MNASLLSGAHWPGLIEHYREFLPVSDRTPIVTLREGNTPLIELAAVGERLGRGIRVWAKFDGLNPTGSFKDRGMTMAVSKAKEARAEAVLCASTGNTSAAAAAYAARAGLRAFVLIPEGYVALGKLAQAVIYGAEVIAIRGNFDQALAIVRAVAERYPINLVNSVNPYRLQGQKTAAFEICDQLGTAPHWLCIPVGNAGNIAAYWMGFSEYAERGRIRERPRLQGFEASGAAALVGGSVQPVARPETVATAIRIGNPASGSLAIAAAQQSGGAIRAVSDPEILAAYQLLAREEGIFCEPASAAAVAGLLKFGHEAASGSQVVCVLTGNGLKDPDCALRVSTLEVSPGLDPEVSAVARAMGF
ncbi:threonine synthase [Gloeobacter kilaueensis]|uniref:Threonine synthase n=1 Tax=Gloeobacter kilaueensis (strain ATCC BAA-2537 / CCAP 1431/1 / ULC 316 / JS1) TaxID=1183438 RepID=U5QMG0_GLOK1|nr:threonine synthase [Gloeobacter kilaueensis]AGY58825.1 threonine synthase [Gloeobacter kilaueensis JS1]